jgi:hypothetical protein
VLSDWPEKAAESAVPDIRTAAATGAGLTGPGFLFVTKSVAVVAFLVDAQPRGRTRRDTAIMHIVQYITGCFD